MKTSASFSENIARLLSGKIGIWIIMDIGLFLGVLSSSPIFRTTGILAPLVWLFLYTSKKKILPAESKPTMLSLAIALLLILSTIISSLSFNGHIPESFRITGTKKQEFDILAETIKFIFCTYSLSVYWKYYIQRPSRLLAISAAAFVVNLIFVFFQFSSTLLFGSFVRSHPHLFLLNTENTNVHGRDGQFSMLATFLRPSGLQNEPSFLAPLFCLGLIGINGNTKSFTLATHVCNIFISLLAFATLSPSVVAIDILFILLLYTGRFISNLFRKLKLNRLIPLFALPFMLLPYISTSSNLHFLNESLGYLSHRLQRFAEGSDNRDNYISQAGLLFQTHDSVLTHIFGFGLFPVGDGSTNSFVDVYVVFGLLGVIVSIGLLSLWFLAIIRNTHSLSFAIAAFTSLIASLFTNSFYTSPLLIAILLLPINPLRKDHA